MYQKLLSGGYGFSDITVFPSLESIIYIWRCQSDNDNFFIFRFLMIFILLASVIIYEINRTTIFF